ncbi:hypothetical protein A2810_02975 [candidate division Kazan bacterium RIFCSPHIGHO2_01_FULL_49_10]|uniref:Uncharacterized protein n=1 Tax=candidate division Kazan bacterium RIFCSPLOWO2_01_FULL_48_13 TaxID=1798539 RepID=A0A1F4PNZ7_UNCK3|nr:MAG: hypothetical protein A2810_02975 [candidate division Kazan bacterium RIFCSPHIGHO2_01_FULL_49_10]OGB85355.1 MAG: hypothetical protein A2994_01850 [candidate division Kazan bacterium RIFCSPLOWO2_01_FULL_48_13]
MSKKANKVFLWLTEEWLIVLIAILILLAIAIGAASARTLFDPLLTSKTTRTLSASVGGSDDAE